MLISRFEKLVQQASQQPLIWAAENKGDVLIGKFVSYKQGVLLIQDMLGVIHRVPEHILGWYNWLQLNEPVSVTTADLIAVQYIGIDYDKEGKEVPIFKTVIDRASDHIYR